MRKSLFVLIAVLALTLAACSSGDGGDEGGTTAGATGVEAGATGVTAGAAGATATGATAATGAGDCSEAAATDLSAGPKFTVTIGGFAFDPDCFMASATASFEVVNEDGVQHTFTVDGVPVDVSLNGGGSFGSIGATPGVVPGTFGFFCRIHPTMTGTVIFV